jgi:hypothetical protein
VPAESLPVTADELAERRKADRKLRLMDLLESLAVQAEASPTQSLRDAFARRYYAAVGISVDRREQFREALRHRINVAVDELIAHFASR